MVSHSFHVCGGGVLHILLIKRDFHCARRVFDTGIYHRTHCAPNCRPPHGMVLDIFFADILTFLLFTPPRRGRMEDVMAVCAAWVDTVTMESELSHQQNAVLHYKIQYPQFSGTYFQRMLNELNCVYKAKAQSVQQGRVRELFCQAIGENRVVLSEEVNSKLALPRYDLVTAFETTFNESCVLSLYFDQYEFTGGAHGTTVRCSDTWNLQRGCCLLLRDLFARSVNYKAYIIENINRQISESISKDGDYFDDYACLTARYFNERQFYLSPEGVVVYFQLYEIAPYAFGIPTFVIPYSPGCVIAPGSGSR